MYTRLKQTELIEKIFRYKHFKNKLRQYSRLKPPPQWQPDITISRDPGSGGKLVAKKLAKKLGWQFYDKKLLKQLAQDLGFPPHIVAAVDEHPRSHITDIFHAAFNPTYISDYTYIKHLKKIILTAGKKEDIVFLGRGANHIIPKDKALHVRITAPFDIRIQNTIHHEHLNKQAATKRVLSVQQNRYNFIKQYFNCNPNDPDNFDLIINTENISLNAAVDIIITAFKKKFPRKQI